MDKFTALYLNLAKYRDEESEHGSLSEYKSKYVHKLL